MCVGGGWGGIHEDAASKNSQLAGSYANEMMSSEGVKWTLTGLKWADISIG